MQQRLAARAAAEQRPTEQCIALIDYDALNPDEISFKAGDVINVTGKGSASGFWEGFVVVPTYPAEATAEMGSDSEKDSATAPERAASRRVQGLFPNCLVTSNMRFKSTLANFAFQSIALCLYSYTATGAEDMSFAPGDVITAVRPSASPGWWYGVKSSGPPWTAPSAAASSTQPSSAPSRFADPASATPRDAAAAGEPRDRQSTVEASPPPLQPPQRELLFPTNFVTCDVVLMSFAFTGRQAHELSCSSGDVVQVHRRWNDGWWEGSLRNQRGIFPSNYSVPNICATSPPLFCPRCRTVFASNLFQSSCDTCAAEEKVEDAMLQALEAYVNGEAAELDLFAGINVGLDPEPASTDSRSPTEGVLDASPSTAAMRDQSRSSASQRGRRAAQAKVERVSLLTDKDLADLASNQVKLSD